MTVAAVISVCVKITAVINAVRETVDAVTGLVVSIRKFVDSFGNVSTQIYYRYDSDGDGELDAEEVIYDIDSYIPDLGEPYQLVDKDGKIGLGYPALRAVDASDVLPALPTSDTDFYTSNGEGFRISLQDDGVLDDILYPVPFDFTGDGVNDFQIIIDDNNNGLPDACPSAPFYPIGSDGYNEIVEQNTDYNSLSIMEKPISKYSVTEGILLIVFIVGAFGFLKKAFRRKKVG